MKRNWIALVMVALPVVLSLSCSKPPPGAEMYETLCASDFALEISFGMTPAEVHEQLGQPLGNVTRQGGANVEEYYQQPEHTVREDTAAEISLTYINNKLIKLDNRYFPEAEIEEFPPFFVEPLTGVKLGLRRSDFVTALGDPLDDPAGDLWRFHAQDGSAVTIRAKFSDIEVIGDSLCSRLTITNTAPIAAPRGEELEK